MRPQEKQGVPDFPFFHLLTIQPTFSGAELRLDSKTLFPITILQKKAIVFIQLYHLNLLNSHNMHYSISENTHVPFI